MISKITFFDFTIGITLGSIAVRIALGSQELPFLATISAICSGLLSDKKKRIKPPFIDICISRICELKKVGTKSFGKKISINERCNGYGFCVKICPAGNIFTRDDINSLTKKMVWRGVRKYILAK